VNTRPGDYSLVYDITHRLLYQGHPSQVLCNIVTGISFKIQPAYVSDYITQYVLGLVCQALTAYVVHQPISMDSVTDNSPCRNDPASHHMGAY